MGSSLNIMHEQLNLADGSPVKMKWCDYDHFTFPLHFHAEFEILYVIKGAGTRFTGNNIEPFSDGDLVLFGSHLPHVYRSGKEYYEGNPNLRVHAITLQFRDDFFSHAFNYYPEFKQIKSLLTNEARYGVYFDKEHNQEIRRRVKVALKKKGLSRLLECIEILSLMSKSKHKRCLSSEDFDGERLIDADKRLVKVLGKLHQNYTQDVKLDEIADLSGMNASAFCRYFKSKTGKSLVQYVNEQRIKFACRLLLEGKMTVTQICYECGFNSLSNFNRQFKVITNYTPSGYLLEFKKELDDNLQRDEHES